MPVTTECPPGSSLFDNSLPIRRRPQQIRQILTHLLLLAPMAIQTTIEFLADLPLYEEEKPYYLHASASAGDRLNDIKITNIEWDTREVTVYSMRDKANISLETN